MSEEVENCKSCFEGFNNKERIPKILACYHTYCAQCLGQFMLNNGIVTCLSCGKETQAKSVNAIPDNPYYRVSNGGRNRATSGTGEEVYYSDSDEEDNDSLSQSAPDPENGVNNDHVEGVKTMVVNTQKANVSKIRQLVDRNLSKIKSSLDLRAKREKTVGESIKALDDFKTRLQEEQKALVIESKQLNSFQEKLNNIVNQLNTINLMDYTALKKMNEDCLFISTKLNQEIEKVENQELETGVRNSTVKINFERTDNLLNNLKAENDTIYMKLGSSLEVDPSLVYLTTYMLGKIFTDKIASHNACYKELVKNSYIEDGIIGPQPLDDPSEYIDYIKSFQGLTLGTDTSRSSSPPDKEEKEWKVVGKDKEKEKTMKRTPISFSDMAKKPGNPQPIVKRIPFPEKTIAQTNRPHCYFKIQVDNETPFRVVFEMRPDMAPKMVDNFIRLCKGLPDGRGYKGSKIFRAKANDHILGGDFENDDGTGGHSAYEDKYFMAEQCPLKDHKGAIRMKGLERTVDGRCRIGSQFMIWVGDLEYKEYRFTLVYV
ncbi:interaptin isoform X2 [Eurytemora carolleeae]|uniref:interaptin isoform X2 n=1 Tax=Eurytemora carolleeae TaxID=1294199 RepID=UPI000C7636C1|nr:interaptin isoform X2 [Eurytemora carolleeae]|eukprot:XP_023326914.1 interaptin-like isoform X2 [Eurytemora affinis]